MALPFLLVISTGILLQLKKQIPWIQPAEQRGASLSTPVSLERILAAAAEQPEAGIRSWADVDRLDIRPAKGVVKVIGTSRWEVQVDLETAEVLQVAYRRSDLIEALHDGSWFHPAVKLWIFLPVAAIVLGLWGTGIYLWWLPIGARRRKRTEA